MAQIINLFQQKGFNINVLRADLTDQHMYIKATSPDISGEVFHFKDRTEPVQGGVIISNSDVGAGAFKVEPFINVLVCQNGLIGENRFTKIHLGKERSIGLVVSEETNKLENDLVWSKLHDIIRSTFTPKLFQEWLDRINKVASNEIPKPTVAIDNIINKYEIPKNRRDVLLNQFSQESPTQWGIAMAITRLAQNEEDYENQIKYEKIGSDILQLKPEILVREVA